MVERGSLNMFRVAAAALGFRLVSTLLGLFAALAFRPDQPAQPTMFGSPSPFWDQFTAYDAGWYYQIARYGYAFVVGGPSAGVGKAGKIAYFPLYPLLARYAGRLFGDGQGAVYLGAIAVSWFAFVAAMIALVSLARLDLPDPEAERAALMTALFPFAFFFGMVYTESLFLLLTVLTFYWFRTGRWLLGGLAGALTTATRVNGILMVPALAWIVWRAAPPNARRRLLAIVGLLLVPAGLAAYSWYVYRLSGHPFEWAVSISRWGYHPGGQPWLAPAGLVRRLVTHPYRYLTSDRMAVYDTLYGVTATVFSVATPFVWWRLGAAYGLFMLVNLWLPLSSGVFEGLGRYCSVLFPFFIWMASFRSRSLATAVVVVFAMFYTLGLALFITRHPLF